MYLSTGIASRIDTSVFDPLRDDQLEHQTEIDKEWETLMVSGPIVVGYLGNLMVLASKKDFPFQAPNGYIYRYIRLDRIVFTLFYLNFYINLFLDIQIRFVLHLLKYPPTCIMLLWELILLWIKFN
jgi:hypothetical protein